MHWTDKRAGRAALAHELMARGWKLFGYHADASDAMTDYYSPASWHGVAVKGDALIAADASMSDSGAAIMQNKATDKGACATCGGSGAAPGPWTLERARTFPREYHQWAIEQEHGANSGVRHFFNDVVSPIPFLDDGRRRCFKCQGKGRDVTYGMEEVSRWPVFQPTPARRNWHVERGGRIIASGIGLYGCEKEGAAKALADKIEAAIAPKPYVPNGHKFKGAADTFKAPPSAAGVPMSLEVRPSSIRNGYVEVVFPEKPSDSVREALKASGFRWAKTAACWYGPSDRLPAKEIGAAL